MSAEVLAEVFRHSEARGIPRLVLLTMAYMIPPDGGFTTVGEIADVAHLDTRSVQRAIRILTESGELEVTTVGTGPGRKRHYRVTCKPPTMGGE